jgi:hypothetical protein
VPSWTDPNLTTSLLVREMHDWWTANRTAAGIPDRSRLDPLALRRLLPNLIISEVQAAPFRIRYRLVGTKVADVTNYDFTGRYLDEILAGGSDTPWLEYYQTVYRNRAPLMGSVTERTTSGDTFTYEFGMFPLTAGGTEVRQFVSVEDYFDFHLTSAELQPWPLPLQRS